MPHCVHSTSVPTTTHPPLTHHHPPPFNSPNAHPFLHHHNPFNITTTRPSNTPSANRAIAGTVGAVLLLTAGWGFFSYTQRRTGADDDDVVGGAPWVQGGDDAESQPLRGTSSGGGPGSNGIHQMKKGKHKGMKLGAQRYAGGWGSVWYIHCCTAGPCRCAFMIVSPIHIHPHTPM